MRPVAKIASGALTAAIVALGLGACGATRPVAQAVTFPLQSFQHPVSGTAGSAAGDLTWRQYGSRPVGRSLTINPMTLENTSTQPLTLESIHQARPVKGLQFGAALVTMTPGFAGYSEYVGLGQPADAFNMHANFSPLHGFLVNPDPKALMSGVSPTVVLTVRATRPGMFHIRDWVVTFREGAAQHSVRLADDGVFCAGGAGACPNL